MNNALDVKNLTKIYREFTLDRVNFTLPEGMIMGMIGPNGAGKTTTIRLLLNMIRSDGGEVAVLGLDPRKNEKELKNRIGYVGEEQHFYENRRVSWTGNFVSHFYANWDHELFRSLLERFEISPKKRIKELSRGMKVKFSFALALSHSADLFILDEPTSGLDPIIRRELLDELKRLSIDENKAVLFSSHITDDVARIADIITFMDHGRILISEEKDQLMARYKRIHFKNGALTDEMKSRLSQVREKMFSTTAVTDDFLSFRQELAGGETSGDIKVENVNLDDILIQLVNGGRT
jgi:ABC-2 type transport system ATP-binding protein